jgi:hypothetical protein
MELNLPLFPIVVALYITIGLQESSARVTDMFDLEMLAAASIQPYPVLRMSFAL